MPIKKSAIKRVKTNEKQRDANRLLKKTFRTDVKNITKKLDAKDVKGLDELVSKAYKSLDKAAKNNAIHKNNAARRKSRLMKKVAEATAKK